MTDTAMAPARPIDTIRQVLAAAEAEAAAFAAGPGIETDPAQDDAEGNAGADTGATIRGTARTLVQRGAAHEPHGRVPPCASDVR